MKIISTNGCVNCVSTKKILMRKGISFEEVKFDSLSKEDQERYKDLARKAGLMSFPLIVTDSDEIISLAEALEYVELKVLKRNGAEVSFDKERIVKAINSAINETNVADDSLAKDIADKVAKKLENRASVSVEEIQDIVETELMSSDRKDVARRYILYRESRNIERTKKSNLATNDSNKLLTDEFISQYKHKKAPFTEFGEFVYYRTYSRWLNNLQRREFWYETVRRAVEYNCSLLKTSREEAEELYDNIFNLRQFLSGKFLPLL